MATSLKLAHTERYSEIATLLYKYGRENVIAASELTALGAAPAAEQITGDDAERAASLTADLERLGPVFVKLGQLLSTRADILPPVYLESLSRLQDGVEPVSIVDIEAAIEEELGGRMSKLFATFDPQPLAAASLGQVHYATLRGGKAVAVKVQRPRVRSQVLDDLDSIHELASFLDVHSAAARRFDVLTIVEELRKSVLRELDYLQEAHNLSVLRRCLEDFEHIVVPAPIDDFCTARVLTMEYVPGKKITDVNPVRWTEIDGEALADELFRAYLRQILIEGFFHADPHPGNVSLTDDDRIALLDLGMTARISPHYQEGLLKLLLAISEGRGDDAAEIARSMGEESREGIDREEFRRRISELVLEHHSAALGKLEMGRVVMQIRIIASDSRLKIPPVFNMLGKALMNLDRVGRTLSRSFDPNRAIRRHSSEILEQRLRKSLSLGTFYQSVLDLSEMAQRLPGRINTIIETVADNELRLRVDAIDEKKFLAVLQKIANRITLGLVLAALIIGAALLMRVPTTSTILGYPALAMLFFLIAAGGAFALIWSIVRHDERDE